MSAIVTPVPATKLFTAEEFAALPEPADGSKQELVRGKVVSMPPPGFVHGIIQGHFYFHLRTWANATQLGRVTVESGVNTETDPDTVRGPDVAFWSYARVPADQAPEAYPDTAADVVVEVLSPSDSHRRLAEKIREYFSIGVRLVWVADPDDRTVTDYAQPGNGTVLWSDATLTAVDVLPGFTCSVASFFESIPE